MEDEGFFLSLLADSPYSTEIFWNMGTRATRGCQQQASCKDSSVWFTYKVTWGMKWTPRNSWKPPERQQRQAGLARVQVWVCTLVVPVAQGPVLFPFKGTVPSTPSWQQTHFCWGVSCHGWPISTPKGSSSTSAIVQPTEQIHIILGNTLERGVDTG